MRDYATFIAFQNLFDSLPGTEKTIDNAANMIFRPPVPIVEADCGTKLGKTIEITTSTYGYIEAISKKPLDNTEALNLLSQGIYSIGVRTISTCVSKKGICQTCYQGSIRVTAPAINTVVKVDSTTKDPFLAYLANSYSGSLIGMLPLPAEDLPIRSTLLETLITDSILRKMELALSTFTNIPELNMEYLPQISDKLEKALYIIALYCLFGHV